MRSFVLVLLAVAAVLAGAVGISTPGRPHGGAITAPAAAAPMAASDDEHPLAGTTGSHPAASGTGPGYVRLASHLVGLTPIGLQVWVDPRAAHHAAIASNASHAVSDMRRQGLNVRWRGYGRPRAAEGIVTIAENNSGCQGGSNVVGMTWPYWMALPGGDLYMYRATIALCPRLFTRYGSGQWAATVRHELGHAVGLGHANYVYRGSYQVMSWITHSGVSQYRAGDVNGIRALAAGSSRVKSEMAPLGHFDGSRWNASNNTIVLTGWALLRYYPGRGVTITVTDNGQVVSSGGTNVLRADVNRRYDPSQRRHGFSVAVAWPGGSHIYCVTATSTVNRAARANLGCVTWRS